MKHAMLADAWATTITVMGPAQGHGVGHAPRPARPAGAADRTMARREYMTPALTRMLE